MITPRFRCATGAVVSTAPTCASGEQLYSYVHLNVTGTYSPMWTRFGVSSPINYTIERTVQIS